MKIVIPIGFIIVLIIISIFTPNINIRGSKHSTNIVYPSYTVPFLKKEEID